MITTTFSHGMEYNEELGKELIQISLNRFNNNLNKEESFSQAQELLKKRANPDFRESPYSPTSLMLAIYHDDQQYAQLFINHNADPAATALYPGRTHEGDITALDMERTGWLKKMVDERKPQTRKKRIYNY